MKWLFVISALLTVALLAGSAMFWTLHASTGADVPRLRAVGLFRWAVVVVLGTFNIWIFTRVGGALIDIWWPEPPPPPPVLIDGQLPGRPPPEEEPQQKN